MERVAETVEIEKETSETMEETVEIKEKVA